MTKNASYATIDLIKNIMIGRFMSVTFCGHSDFEKSPEYERKILDLLEANVGDAHADMYLGDYGGFDDFAHKCCRIFKETHPNVKLVFVTPYLAEDYLDNRLRHRKNFFDSVVFPNIEDKPKRLAIFYRNRYMVEKADFIVAYVTKSYGGAYATYKYAEGKKKKIFNIAN